MSQVDWVRVKDIFYAALNQPAGEVDAFLSVECSGDQELRQEVEVLIRSYQSDFLEKPVILSEINAPRFGAGDIFGHYRIVKMIGKGGMGEVYLAEDQNLKRHVALKILTVRLSSGDAAARFRIEARLASRIQHPSIATVYEFGEIGEHHFIAIEYIEGKTLRELISTNDIVHEQVELIAVSVASALKAAHDLGIIHRDIKPENILVKGDGSVTVLDFGLAKIVHAAKSPFNDTVLETVPGLLLGTSAYMSPEQVRGHLTDDTTDFWSFGVVLYEMLAGRRPFEGATSSDVWASILRDQPDPLPEAAKSFSQVVDRCLQKDPNNRYRSADELSHALEDLKGSSVKDRAAPSISLTRQTNHVTVRDGQLITASDDDSDSKSKQPMRFFHPARLLVGTIVLAAAIGAPIAYTNFYPSQQETADATLADRSETTTESTAPSSARTNSIGMEFVYIPPGEFIMGSEDGQDDEKPVRRVSIADGFWMSKHEVTQAQYESLFGTNPSETKGCADCPVDNILWYGAKAVIWKLNAGNDEFVYSLPSEAEWEYAARAGSTGLFAGKLDDLGWYMDNSNYRQHPVGGKKPNAFGLHDMHGNVWEWCEDIYQKDYTGVPTDGTANISLGDPAYRVLRGGSARNDQSWARSSRRLRFGPKIKFFKNDFGIRVVARERSPAQS